MTDPHTDFRSEPPATVSAPVADVPYVPHILIVGAAGRNVGKTSLSCAIIQHVSRTRPIVGVKVTTVEDHAGGCPRGDEGCGVCESLVGPWSITEETAPPEGKDTARLLDAGASAVFWLRVHSDRLADGVRALLDRLPKDVPVVCEGNRLRTAVEPGLFVVVHKRGSDRMKPSCRSVWSLADAAIPSDDGRPAVRAEAFGLQDGRWTFRRRATAVVLAGGRSRRMGRDKALLEVDGRPLIQRIVDRLRPHFERVVVSADDAAKYAFLDLEVIPDQDPDQGPMMAIASTLLRSPHDLNFYVPCDLPDIPLRLMARLLRHGRTGGGADIVVPITPKGRYEPLFAVYRKTALPVIERHLAAGERKIIQVYEDCSTVTVPLQGAAGLENVNTMADYLRLPGARP